MAGRLVMPRERQVSPSGAQRATSPRIMYCRGEKSVMSHRVVRTCPWTQAPRIRGRTLIAHARRMGYALLSRCYAPALAGAGGSAGLTARRLHHLVALRAQLQEGLGLDIKPGHDRDSQTPSRPRGRRPWAGSNTRRRSGAPSPARSRWAGRDTRCAPSGGRPRPSSPRCSR